MTPDPRQNRAPDRRKALGVLAAGGAALAAGLAAWRRLGRPAPDEAVAALLSVSLPDASGKPLAFARFANRPLVVNFWATWCPPCVEEMPELSALHQELAPKGLQMLGIGIDSAAKIAEFAARSPISYPLVVAGLGGTELGKRLGNANGLLPFTVLIDRHGRIAQRIPGRVNIQALRAAIASLED